jgi:holo-[acyl-carrier protein] synthase
LRTLRTGIDLVQVSRIAESLQNFGEKFMRRLFTEHEIAYSTSSEALMARRFAKRFAAKEATIKALSLSDAGLDWRQIEVLRDASGQCSLALHGVAREAAERARVSELSLSLSHDGDYATAMVVALTAEPDSKD